MNKNNIDISKTLIDIQKTLDSQSVRIECLEYELFLLKKERLLKNTTTPIDKVKNILSPTVNNLELAFPNKNLININNKDLCEAKPDAAIIWGEHHLYENREIVKYAHELELPLYIAENGFIRSAYCWEDGSVDFKFSDAISFIVSSTQYFDATKASEMEKTLSNPNFKLSDEEKKRARACIDKIVKTHLTKYNHQPIFEPKIGREGVKKILVIDQAYRDMSIQKGLANDETFERMLHAAIDENPNADIIVKTHPDAIQGSRKGYYQHLKSHDNVYALTEPINPISLINYCDKIYVCSSQFGFEALMCNKEVHIFGMPFYAGWGLTKDRQICPRRNVKRTLEEIFYAAYISNTIWVNPEKKSQCEIEEALDYILKLREEYFTKEALIKKCYDFIETVKEKTVLWGASIFLSELLNKYTIKNPNIVGIVDRDVSRHGKNLKNLTIFSPEKIAEIKPQKIILTVQNNNEKIYKSLAETLKKDFPEVELLPNIFEE